MAHGDPTEVFGLGRRGGQAHDHPDFVRGGASHAVFDRVGPDEVHAGRQGDQRGGRAVAKREAAGDVIRGETALEQIAVGRHTRGALPAQGDDVALHRVHGQLRGRVRC